MKKYIVALLLIQTVQLLNAAADDEGLSVDIACLSIKNGADIDARDNFGHTRLFKAVLGYDEDLVQSLLANGADVNARDVSGNTPLIAAISAVYPDQNYYGVILELLIAKGADINSQDNYGYTPLHQALSFRYLPCVLLLLEQENINIDLKSKYDERPIDCVLNSYFCWKKDDYLQILQAFAQRGAPLSDASYQNDFDRLIEDGIITQEERADIMSWVVEDVKMAQD